MPPSPNGNNPAHTNGNGKPRLTRKQREKATRDALILRELAAGKSTAEVGLMVGLTPRAVRYVQAKNESDRA